jgi:hypothetical protein
MGEAIHSTSPVVGDCEPSDPWRHEFDDPIAEASDRLSRMIFAAEVREITDAE